MRKVSVSYGDQSAQLKEIRAADPDGQGRHSFTAQQQTLRRLNTVFASCLRRARDLKRNPRRVGFPRFKPYQRFDQVLFVAGDGAKWEPAEPVPLPPTGRSVGVDVGVARFLTTSDGEIIANPRRVVDTYDILALEDLRVAAMTKTASGSVEKPGRNVAAKAGLNRSILDAGWGQLTSILAAKAASAGRRVVLVHPASTSIDCHACGARCIRPRQDTIVCPNCGDLDADLNGARNIAVRAGLGSGQVSAA
jgi:putative transposase